MPSVIGNNDKRIDPVKYIQQQYYDSIAEFCNVDVLINIIISYAPMDLEYKNTMIYNYDPIIGRCCIHLREVKNPWTARGGWYQVERKKVQC